jgi:hypothetical protein
MRVLAFLIASVFSVAVLVSAQQKPLLSKQEQAIQQQVRGLRSLPDDTRVVTTKRLATDIRGLPTLSRLNFGSSERFEPLLRAFGQIPTAQLTRDMVSAGIKAKLTCVDPSKLDRSYAGRDFDLAFLEGLGAEIDLCGENGEFHIFVYDAPSSRGRLTSRSARSWNATVSSLPT